MTSVVETPDRSRGPWRDRLPPWPRGWPRIRPRPYDEELTRRNDFAAAVLTVVSIVLVTLLLNVMIISQVQHFAAQNRLYDSLRLQLAEGSIPIGQTGVDGRLVEPGSPVALLRIPALGISEVVVEGTASQQTKVGVGHRRDTPLPGQAGVSVLMGRRTAYGGVFKRLGDLQPGQEFSVTTGQGTARYRVLGRRTASTKLAVLGQGAGRLTLVTASGSAFRPSGALRVDAELLTQSSPRPAPVIGAGAIAEKEGVLRGDTSQAFALSWLIEALVIAVVAAAWSWRRWDRRATWIVFLPVVGLLALSASDRVTSLLPNLL